MPHHGDWPLSPSAFGVDVSHYHASRCDFVPSLHTAYETLHGASCVQCLLPARRCWYEYLHSATSFCQPLVIIFLPCSRTPPHALHSGTSLPGRTEHLVGQAAPRPDTVEGWEEVAPLLPVFLLTFPPASPCSCALRTLVWCVHLMTSSPYLCPCAGPSSYLSPFMPCLPHGPAAPLCPDISTVHSFPLPVWLHSYYHSLRFRAHYFTPLGAPLKT